MHGEGGTNRSGDGSVPPCPALSRPFNFRLSQLFRFLPGFVKVEGSVTRSLRCFACCAPCSTLLPQSGPRAARRITFGRVYMHRPPPPPPLLRARLGSELSPRAAGPVRDSEETNNDAKRFTVEFISSTDAGAAIAVVRPRPVLAPPFLCHVCPPPRTSSHWPAQPSISFPTSLPAGPATRSARLWSTVTSQICVCTRRQRQGMLFDPAQPTTALKIGFAPTA